MNNMTMGAVESRFADLIRANEPVTSGQLVKLCETEALHILGHEEFHFQRRDHRIKVLAFPALCIHCFSHGSYF